MVKLASKTLFTMKEKFKVLAFALAGLLASATATGAAIMSDLPTEVTINPDLWGTFRFQ